MKNEMKSKMKGSMNDQQFEDALKKEVEQLQREMKPGKDLWPGIDHAINSNTVTLSKPVIVAISVAASIVLAVSLSITGALYLSKPLQETRNIPSLISFLQSEHERNKQALLVEYQGQSALAPDWELQMQQLEQAEQAIYQALREDADNIELLKILRQVQTKQIELIESVYTPLFTAI